MGSVIQLVIGALATTATLSFPTAPQRANWTCSFQLLPLTGTFSSSSSVLGSEGVSERWQVQRLVGRIGRCQLLLMGATMATVTHVGSNAPHCVHNFDRGTVFGSNMKGEVGWKKLRRNVRIFVDNGESGGRPLNPEDTVQTTLEQSRRLLAMQKELLLQIEERKKLYAGLGRNAENATDQTKAYNEPAIQRLSEQITQNVEALQFDQNTKSDGEDDTDATVPSLSRENLNNPAPRRAMAAVWPSAISPRISRPPGTNLEPGRTQAKSSIRSQRQPMSQHSASSILRPTVTPAPTSRVNLIVPPSSPWSAANPKAPEQGTTQAVPNPPPLAGSNVLNVVLVAAECAPWSKTGGLGDVVGALPKALAQRGHRVMVVAPRYSNYEDAWDTRVRKVYNVGGQDMEIGYYHGYKDQVDFVFVDASMFHACVDNIYGGHREDVLLRMILLCKASVEAPWHVPCGGVTYGDGNLVFIANDWHTALLPVYLRAYYQDKGLMAFSRCILVIHNMAHQGRGPMSDFEKFGLPAHYADKFCHYDPIGGEHCNVFKAGFMLSHRIVTVSQGYAHEVQTCEGGWGLDGIIRDNSWKLRGVVNGIDDEEWNPEIDPCLKDNGYSNYSIGNLSGKAACKAALQKELGLPVRRNVPLIGFIGRLDFQKGVDIIAEAIPWMMTQDLQLVMLGTGRKDLEDMLHNFEHQYSDKVRGWVGFSVKTAHRITAGVDIILMPSRFEPCGLNQLYGMRYGTIPIVHSVGGLRDTVQPFDPFAEAGTGWTFDCADASGLIHALGNAMWTYHEFKSSWEALQRRGMAQDLSWHNAAQLYEEVLVAAKYQW